MKLKTKQHTVTVLHVEVPETIIASDFETDIGVCVRDGVSARIKDGIEVDAEALHNQWEETAGQDHWHADVSVFIQAVCAIKPVPDQFLFHR